jgi:hypothetical protein
MDARALAATAVVAAGVMAAVAGSSTAGAAAARCVVPRGTERIRLDPADFTTRITNPWWPMKVGSMWTYRETAPDGTVQRDVVTVLPRTKVVANGVTPGSSTTRRRRIGEPVEVTDDLYAQDRCGNVWYLGEATTEYENGKPVSTEGSFEAGEKGAQAGRDRPAHPRPGMSYRQEDYKATRRPRRGPQSPRAGRVPVRATSLEDRC